MDPTDLINLIAQRKWVAVLALAIGLIVRLLKTDTKLPLDVPPQLRVWLALALGAASGAVDKLVEAGSTTWTTALLNGIAAAVLAIVSHNLVIASLRDGKELPIPGLIKPGVAPSPGNPPTIPPGSFVGLLILGACLTLGGISEGCKPGQTPRETARATVLVVAEAVHQLDGACAKISTAKHDAALGNRCADAYDVARYSLIGAESALDAYDTAGTGDMPCAIRALRRGYAADRRSDPRCRRHATSRRRRRLQDRSPAHGCLSWVTPPKRSRLRS